MPTNHKQVRLSPQGLSWMRKTASEAAGGWCKMRDRRSVARLRFVALVGLLWALQEPAFSDAQPSIPILDQFVLSSCYVDFNGYEGDSAVAPPWPVVVCSDSPIGVASASGKPGFVKAEAGLLVFPWYSTANSYWTAAFRAESDLIYLVWDAFALGYTFNSLGINSITGAEFGLPLQPFFPVNPVKPGSAIIALTPNRLYRAYIYADARTTGDFDEPYIHYASSFVGLDLDYCGDGEPSSLIHTRRRATFAAYEVHEWIKCGSPWGFRFQWVPAGGDPSAEPKKWIGGCFYPVGDNYFEKGPAGEFLQINVAGVLAGTPPDESLTADIHIYDPTTSIMTKRRSTVGDLMSDLQAGRLPGGTELWRGPPSGDPDAFACVEDLPCLSPLSGLPYPRVPWAVLTETTTLDEGDSLTVDWLAAPTLEERTGREWKYELTVAPLGTHVAAGSTIEIVADGLVGAYVGGLAASDSGGRWVVADVEKGRAIFQATATTGLSQSVSGFVVVSSEGAAQGLVRFVSQGGWLGSEGTILGPVVSDLLLFSDGFESGDTTAWSRAVPGG